MDRYDPPNYLAGVYGMRKYGWKWASAKALDAYKLILVDSAFCHGSFGGSEDLNSFIDLADEIVRLEGRIPDSFKVAVDLGSIYSAAAVSNAGDVKVSDEFIAKANEAWCIASTHLENGMLRDAALVEPGPLRATYVGGYLQIPCEIGFARYIQTNCTDVSHLRALKKYWVRAKQERPNHPVLLAVGEQIDKKLSPAEQTEQIQERSPVFLPGIEQSELEPGGQGRRGLRIGAIVIVTIATLTGLAYVYRTMDRAREPQQGAAAGSVRSSSDRATSVPSETTGAAPSNQRQAIAPSGDKEPETVSSAEEPAEAVPTLQEPIKQYQQNGNVLRRLEARIRARAKHFIAPSRDIPTNARAVYSVTLTSTGKVEELTLTKSSGHAGFDQSVREALLKAQPYPRVAELLGNGVSRTAIVAMMAERPLPPKRKVQRAIPHRGPEPELSEPRLGEMQSDIDSSEEAFQTSPQPVASSAISPTEATPRKVEECAAGFVGIICRERKRWERCSGRWGTPGCEVYPGPTATD
jgi:TonB family protein